MADPTLINISQIPSEPIYNVPDQELGLTAKPCAMSKEKEDEQEPVQKVCRTYFTDLNGNEIEDVSKEEEVYFVIESENMGGEEVIIAIPDQSGDFVYKDELVTEEKVLKLSLGGDSEKVKLEVVPSKGDYTPARLNNYHQYDTTKKEEEEELVGEDVAQIVEAYWADEDGKPTDKILYQERPKIIIRTSNATGKTMKVKIYEQDPGPDDYIVEDTFTISGDSIEYSFELTGANFEKGGDEYAEFCFTLQLDDLGVETYCDGSDDLLKASVVRYIPGIMKAQTPAWNTGAALMEHWFNSEKFTWAGKAEDHANYDTLPSNDTIVTLAWFKKFQRGLDAYNKITDRQQKIWVSFKAKLMIKKYLQRENLLIDQENTTHFNFIKSNAHQSNKFTSQFVATASGDSRNLDDFYAALANSEIRASVNGAIIPVKNEDDEFIGWNININKVGVYVRDSYDFIDDPAALLTPKTWVSQPLGFWNPKSNMASGKAEDRPFGYYVTNGDYRNWRDRTGKGGDFLVFSDIETFTTNDTFFIDKNFNLGQ